MKKDNKSLAKNETKSVASDVFNKVQASKEIRSLHLSILVKSFEAFELSVKLGEKLVGIKESLPHGHFKKFLDNDVKIVSIRTSQRYMQFYFYQDELREKLGDNLDISRATKYISSLNKKIKSKTESDTDKKEIEETQKTIDYHYLQRKEAIKRFKKGNVLPSDKILLIEEYTEKKKKKVDELSRTEMRIQKAEMRLQKLRLQKETIEQDLQQIENL